MGNFNDYLNSSGKNTSKQTENKNSERPSNEKLEDMINEYQKLNSNELMNEFIKLTIEKKKKGELKKEELDSIRQTIVPYLNGEQKTMLEKLLDLVENV